jgi:hypothetical protein
MVRKKPNSGTSGRKGLARPRNKAAPTRRSPSSPAQAAKPSGCQNRRRAKERKAQLEAADGALALPPEVLDRIGPPPEDPTKVLPWVNRAMVEVTCLILHQVGVNIFERARHLREMAKALGMVYPRAEVEELLRRLLDGMAGKKDKSGGTETLAAGDWKRPVIAGDTPTDRLV